jgi:hypothetical protein
MQLDAKKQLHKISFDPIYKNEIVKMLCKIDILKGPSSYIVASVAAHLKKQHHIARWEGLHRITSDYIGLHRITSDYIINATTNLTF